MYLYMIEYFRYGFIKWEKVDSTHMEANIDIFRAVQKSKELDDDDNDPTALPGAPDPDARMGVKSKDKKFFGYKHHIGIDSDHDFITNSGTSGGNISRPGLSAADDRRSSPENPRCGLDI